MIRFEKVNEVYHRVYCDHSTAYELNDKFSFFVEGYKYMPKYKNGLWDGKIRFFNPSKKLVYSGLINEIKKHLDLTNRKYEDIDPETGITPDLSLYKISDKKSNIIDPRDYQIKGVNLALKNKRGILLSATSSGKSLMIYLAIREYQRQVGKPVLLIVPSVQLVEQMYDDFADYAKLDDWDTETNCHRVYAGKDKNTDKPITISTWQSIQNLKAPYFSKFGFCLFDEVHKAQAVKARSILEKLVNCDYRIGTTGTKPERTADDYTISGLFGQTFVIKKTIDLIKDGHASPLKIVMDVLEYPADTKKKFSSKINDLDAADKFRKEMDYLSNNAYKQKHILKILREEKNNNGVIFIKKLNDFPALQEYLKKSKKCFFLSGSTPVSEREKIKKFLEKNSGYSILATYALFSTGISINNLNYAIFASPTKSKISSLQSIGRLLRVNGKSSTLYDIVDDFGNNNYALNHAKERVEFYHSEEHELEFRKFEL